MGFKIECVISRPPAQLVMVMMMAGRSCPTGTKGSCLSGPFDHPRGMIAVVTLVTYM